MTTFDNSVSIHPYFKIKPGQLEALQPILERMTALVVNEDKCLHYNFTLCGDVLFCRESYTDASGLLEHSENVGAVLEELLAISEMTRVELHGPADELEKLKSAFDALNPEYYVLQCGIGR